MPSIEASIQAALFARAASLVLSPVHPVAWPNMAFTPPASKKYLRVKHFTNSTDSPFLGNSSSDRYQGILQITVCAPLNSGETAVKEIAGQIARHFRKGLPLYSDGVKVKITKKPSLATPITGTTEIEVPISINYRSFK